MEEIIKEFRESFPNTIAEVIDDFGSNVNSDIERFLIAKLQNQLNEIQTMIADEIRTAQKENQPTSRLTSLSVRIDEKFHL